MKKAFTLIELLVVIAIIAILAAILFPVFAQAKQAAKSANDISNLKQINLAGLMYAADYDDALPSSGEYGAVVGYSETTPAGNFDGIGWGRWYWMFLYTPYIKSKVNDITRPAGDNFYNSPLNSQNKYSELAGVRAGLLINRGLDQQWGLTVQGSGSGMFARYRATYGINENITDEWPNLSSWEEVADSFHVLAATDSEIESDELDELFSRRATCPSAGSNAPATGGGHAGGLNYAYLDGSVRHKKTTFSIFKNGNDEGQCNFTWASATQPGYVFPQGGRQIRPSNPYSNSVAGQACGEWTAPSDKRDPVTQFCLAK